MKFNIFIDLRNPSYLNVDL